MAFRVPGIKPLRTKPVQAGVAPVVFNAQWDQSGVVTPPPATAAKVVQFRVSRCVRAVDSQAGKTPQAYQSRFVFDLCFFHLRPTFG